MTNYGNVLPTDSKTSMAQSAQSSTTTTSPAIKPEQPVPREKTHTSPIPTQRQTPQTKQPHRLAKHFDKEKGQLCFACKKWGHLSSDCPEKLVFKIDLTRAQPCYVMGEIQKQPIRVQVDSGSQVSQAGSTTVRRRTKAWNNGSFDELALTGQTFWKDSRG